jgi:hypothetical protein
MAGSPQLPSPSSNRISASFKMGGFYIQVSIDLDIVQSPLGFTSWFLIFAFCVLCDMQDLYSQIPCLNLVLFSSALFSFRAKPFFYLGTIRRWTWNGVNLKIPLWRFHVHCNMHAIVWDESRFYCYWCKYWVALNPGLGGVGSNCISITAHQQAQSNRACNISIFVAFGCFQSSLFVY